MRTKIFFALAVILLSGFTTINSLKSEVKSKFTAVYVGKFFLEDPNTDMHVVRVFVDPGNQSIIIGGSLSSSSAMSFSATGTYSSDSPRSVANFHGEPSPYVIDYTGTITYP